ncbi:uncharacterized protein BX664DRAFT_326012 [Halteromyces radiatus]|uniref:uncharacterized protein n=1 Tax=Halteromyces radiatus TaxID=101107 RepID=UPI00221EF03E|nr:uncharacterized protein BX664DRAFT_326012 [Halteromyces radiatus]KAI8097281.1 hypothetical protein BX664DRAFT_326012 [Halteromyces radiatus]
MEEDLRNNCQFIPALWRQRREFILDTLKKHKAQKILDYGCGEGSVLSFLIPPSAYDDIHFTHLIGLDIDRNLLEQETIAACQPWPSDYEYLRETPLTVDIYHGSVDQLDSRLIGTCDAIICSEVIEHLYPSCLDACLPLMLGSYAPPLVIVTTPNAEYNVFFPNLNYGTTNSTFRHDDHKFEWTRQQFQEWCIKGAKQYGYKVEFHGIGLLDGKLDMLDYGHCTQACVFTKQQGSSSTTALHQSSIGTMHTTDTPHTLLKRFEFPYYNIPSLPDKEILVHIESYISDYCQAATTQIQQAVEKEKDVCFEQEDDVWSTDNYSFDTQDNNNEDSTNNTAGLTWCTEYTYEDHHTNDDNDDTQDQWTLSPVTISMNTLWSTLHIRQLCKTRQRFLDVLQLDQENYRIMGEQLVVHKSFRIKNNAGYGLDSNG